MQGGVDRRGHCFRPGGVGVMYVRKVSCSGDGTQSSPGALSPGTTSVQRSADEVGASTPCGWISIRGGVDFVSTLVVGGLDTRRNF